jgi:excisionase family DNA binding protein
MNAVCDSVDDAYLSDVEEGLLTVPQVCELLQVGHRLVRESLIQTGKLRAYKLGGEWRVARSSLRSFLETSVIPPGEESPSARHRS